MLVTTPALVISTIKYGEADLIARVYSRDLGLNSYMLKGIRKAKKAKLRTSMFQPLTQVEIETNHKNKGALEYIKNLTVTYPYATLHQDIFKSSVALFFSEILTQLLKEQQGDEQLFDYLTYVFRYLDQTDHVANHSIKILLDLTSFMGFQPDRDTTGDYFNLWNGNFDNDGMQPHHSTDLEASYLKKLIGMDFDKLHEVRMSRHERSNLLNLVIDYFQIHLHSFKKPNSLSILKQLFDA
jgi:DNA repair protein RecO (recombination protein O)